MLKADILSLKAVLSLFLVKSRYFVFIFQTKDKISAFT